MEGGKGTVQHFRSESVDINPNTNINTITQSTLIYSIGITCTWPRACILFLSTHIPTV